MTKYHLRFMISVPHTQYGHGLLNYNFSIDNTTSYTKTSLIACLFCQYNLTTNNFAPFTPPGFKLLVRNRFLRFIIMKCSFQSLPLCHCDDKAVFFFDFLFSCCNRLRSFRQKYVARQIKEMVPHITNSKSKIAPNPVKSQSPIFGALEL